MSVPDGYQLSDDPQRLDRELVHRWLSEQAYWSLGRPREVQDAAIDASLNFGAYSVAAEEQVAYARIVTDGATFGWLCDVFVDEGVRGQGIGSALVGYACASVEPLRLAPLLLATANAHEVYRRFGFRKVEHPERFMTRTPGPAG
jgi:GNAT superfamily N-acetyltransferase